MELSPWVLLGGLALGLGAVALAGGGGDVRQITKPEQLGRIRGDRFLVLVYNPSDEGSDPLVSAFLGLGVEGIQFLAMPFGIVQSWEQLSDLEIESRTVLVAVDVPEDRSRQFPLPDRASLPTAVQQAVEYLAGGVEAKLELDSIPATAQG